MYRAIVYDTDWVEVMAYDASEQDVVMARFTSMLWAVTKDGGAKRSRKRKPPWWSDESHEAAMFSHLNKWKHNELMDKDSQQHPLVHLAWRALAIAYQETNDYVDPAVLTKPKEDSHGRLDRVLPRLRPTKAHTRHFAMPWLAVVFVVGFLLLLGAALVEGLKIEGRASAPADAWVSRPLSPRETLRRSLGARRDARLI